MKNSLSIFSALMGLLTIFLISSPLKAQPVDLEWGKRYDGPDNYIDVATDIAVDNSGNVYVTGYSRMWNEGIHDDWVTIKYSSSGAELWVQRFDSPSNGDDRPNKIVVDSQGDVIVVGYSADSSPARKLAQIVKYSTGGAEEWTGRYYASGQSDNEWNDIVLDVNDNIYVAGYMSSYTEGLNYHVQKWSPDGTREWLSFYNGSGGDTDMAHAIAVDGANNIYVTGQSKGTGGVYDYVTIKYDNNGNEQWVKRYHGGGNQDYVGYSIAVDGFGNSYVTGIGNGSGGYYESVTLSYNTNGDVRWTAYIPNADFSSLAADIFGNVYVTGALSISKMLTVKYNTNGAQVWSKEYAANRQYNFPPSDIVIAPDRQSVYVSGTGQVTVYNRYILIKYTANGVEEWVQSYPVLPLNKHYDAHSLTVDGQENIFITGSGEDGLGLEDYITVKYSIATSVEDNTIPTAFELNQNYPNPFNPSTTIKYGLPEASNVTIKVYNMMGQEVKTLVNSYKPAGRYEVEWNGENEFGRKVSSGTYLYRVTAGEYVSVKKMVLMK